MIPEGIVRLIYTFLLFAGAILIGLSVLMMQSVQRPEEYYLRTNGYVQASKTVGPGQYEVSIEYPLPDSTTRVARGIVQSESVVVEGDRLIVHYNPYSPNEISLQTLPPMKPEFLIFFGILVGGLGFRLFIRSFFQHAKERFIRENGKRITPFTTEIESTSVKLLWVIKIQAIRIHCSWKPLSGTEDLNFYSEPYPLSFASKLKLQSVRVYFLPQAPERYFIEI
ncbi:MAG: DUF3592 domain-containing protein [Spirochaetaceae bacterium]|nr:DUF3592 domain-containing protein [Spirochaetaceae bacterium]